jgi:hypothetical protein
MTIGALAAGFLGDAYGRLEWRLRVKRTLSYFNALLVRALHGVPKVSRFAH